MVHRELAPYGMKGLIENCYLLKRPSGGHWRYCVKLSTILNVSLNYLQELFNYILDFCLSCQHFTISIFTNISLIGFIIMLSHCECFQDKNFFIFAQHQHSKGFCKPKTIRFNKFTMLAFINFTIYLFICLLLFSIYI